MSASRKSSVVTLMLGEAEDYPKQLRELDRLIKENSSSNEEPTRVDTICLTFTNIHVLEVDETHMKDLFCRVSSVAKTLRCKGATPGWMLHNTVHTNRSIVERLDLSQARLQWPWGRFISHVPPPENLPTTLRHLELCLGHAFRADHFLSLDSHCHCTDESTDYLRRVLLNCLMLKSFKVTIVGAASLQQMGMNIDYILHACFRNPHLKTLELNSTSRIPQTNFFGVIPIDREAHSLKKLSLSGLRLDSGFTSALCSYLAQNWMLEDLHIHVQHLCDAIPLFHVLQSKNRTLKRLSISHENSEGFGGDEVMSMVVDNHILEEVSIYRQYRKVTKVWTHLDYYLLLNRAGRNKLYSANGAVAMQTFDWVEAIVTCRFSVPALFFFLQKNPSLLRDCRLTRRPVLSRKCKRRKEE